MAFMNGTIRLKILCSSESVATEKKMINCFPNANIAVIVVDVDGGLSTLAGNEILSEDNTIRL